MSKIFNWVTKNVILSISGFLSLLFIVFLYKDVYFFFYDLNNSLILNLFQYLRISTWISLPIFIFCLSSKEEAVFVSWKRFTIIYFLIYLFFIILVPWDWGDVFLPIYKGTVALSLVILYSIISFILIITKSIQLKKNNL